MSQRIGNLPANINIMNPVPNKEQYETAMQELTAALHELEGC